MYEHIIAYDIIANDIIANDIIENTPVQINFAPLTGYCSLLLCIGSPTSFVVVDDDLGTIREEDRRTYSPELLPAECDQYTSSVSDWQIS